MKHSCGNSGPLGKQAFALLRDPVQSTSPPTATFLGENPVVCFIPLPLLLFSIRSHPDLQLNTLPFRGNHKLMKCASAYIATWENALYQWAETSGWLQLIESGLPEVSLKRSLLLPQQRCSTKAAKLKPSDDSGRSWIPSVPVIITCENLPIQCLISLNTSLAISLYLWSCPNNLKQENSKPVKTTIHPTCQLTCHMLWSGFWKQANTPRENKALLYLS